MTLPRGEMKGDVKTAGEVPCPGMRALHVLSVLAACGGEVGTPQDARRSVDADDRTVIPVDEPDDSTPYELARDCGALVTWTLPANVFDLRRVAAISRSEAWVIANHTPVPEGGGTLVHLRSDGSVVETAWDGIHDVWTCGDVAWATARGGLLLRSSSGSDDFALVAEIAGADLLSGFGCAGDIWLAAGDRIEVRGDGAPNTVAIEVDQASVWPLRMHGAGQVRVATEYYGGVLEYDLGVAAFTLAGGTDDIITDAFVRRDGTGISLHGGYGLHFDPAMPIMHETVEGLVANRVSRRADDDAWFVGGAVATHLTASGFEVISLPASHGDDVDARFDGVWAVGFDGAAILTRAGFCTVAVTSR